MAIGGVGAHALTYQTSTQVEFTFEPVLTVTTSGDLVISDLNPGAFADSNTITVTVNTNNAYGYNLSATVGDSSNPSSELRHENYTTSGDPVFSNLALGADLARATFSTDTTYDDKWGFSTDGTTYNGLPLYNDNEHNVTLLSSNYMPTNGTASTNFLIGAKASATKSSGEYSNVINFVAVANAGPMTLSDAYQAAGKTKYKGYYKMQDMKGSGICDNTDILDDQLQVIDVRDDKVYWIAKLQDGHCWMTQNLDLDLETTPNHVATLTSENTDLNEYGANGYTSTNGYSCSGSEATDCEGGVITWTPAYATTEVTYDSEMKGTFPSIGNSSTEYNIPKSLNVGDWYYAGYDGTTLLSSTTIDYLTSTNRTQSNGVTTVNNGSGVDYFSTAPFTGTGTSNNGEHGHVGNYYNWSASVASNDTSGFTTHTHDGGVSGNPANSICPAGWRLPTTTGQSPTYSEEGSRNEFARLVYLYNNNSYVTNSSAKLEAEPLFFARGGYAYGSSLNLTGNLAFYWSSSVNSSNFAYYLYFLAPYVYPADSSNRYNGFSVRCLAQ